MAAAASAAGGQHLASYCEPHFHSRGAARGTLAFSPVAGATRLWPLPELVSDGRLGAPATCAASSPAARRRAGAGGLRMGFSRRDPDSPRGFKGLVYNVVTSAKMVAQGVLVGAVGYLLLTNVPWSQIALPDVQWSLLPGKVADLTLPGKGHSAGAVTAAGEAQSWDDLTSKQHDAAEILGFDQGSWDSDAMVQIDRKSWDQLTAEEREAATTLSFDQRFWDRDVFVDIYERAWVRQNRS
ncbi:hypothetical protein T484DRAFT_1824648 [Baffinella frigidus]|nr:hypothetical protein T484DRAFT_1824648 [Cryptophyta sp. CCMP2293]